MYSHQIYIRVRYAETDQMGYVYYGNYATYFEVGRVEALRHLGISYKELEAQGVMMPVLDHYSKFIAPGTYDENLKLEVRIPESPGIRIRFEYTIWNEAGKQIHEGYTTLVFVDKMTGRPRKAPDNILKVLNPYFE